CSPGGSGHSSSASSNFAVPCARAARLMLPFTPETAASVRTAMIMPLILISGLILLPASLETIRAIMEPMTALQRGSSIGRISRLVDSQQVGTITGDDGKEYVFSSSSLRGLTFGQLSLGTSVSFSP